MSRNWFVALLVVVFGIATFAGCSGGDAPGPKPKSGSSKTTKSSATTDAK